MMEGLKTTNNGVQKDTRLDDEESSPKISLRFTMDKRISLAFAVATVLFGAFLIVGARGYRSGIFPDPITARGMPYILGTFLIICGLFNVVTQILSWSRFPGNLVPGEGHEDEEGHPSSWVRAFSIVLAAWVSVWLLHSGGYLIATPLFLFFAFWVMGTRSWGLLIGFPVIYTLATWYIFSQPLQFAMPLGFLAPFFRSLGLTP